LVKNFYLKIDRTIRTTVDFRGAIVDALKSLYMKINRTAFVEVSRLVAADYYNHVIVHEKDDELPF